MFYGVFPDAVIDRTSLLRLCFFFSLLVFTIMLTSTELFYLDEYFQDENEKLLNKLQEKESLLKEVCV